MLSQKPSKIIRVSVQVFTKHRRLVWVASHVPGPHPGFIAKMIGVWGGRQ